MVISLVYFRRIISGKKASFNYNSKAFKFVSVTDPAYKEAEKTIDAAYLVISIPTDDFDGFGYFKFVASVFPI